MAARSSTTAPILAIVAALLGAYVAGYFWLGERSDWEHAIERFYPNAWIARVYRPAGKVEGLVRGVKVIVAGPKYDPDSGGQYE